MCRPEVDNSQPKELSTSGRLFLREERVGEAARGLGEGRCRGDDPRAHVEAEETAGVGDLQTEKMWDKADR